LEVTDVLPPPNHDDVQVLVMAVTYMLLFMVGICGNVAVLTTIRHVVHKQTNNQTNKQIN
jgi:heme/copper-type cytochrome/quinol oxidase subunit 2